MLDDITTAELRESIDTMESVLLAYPNLSAIVRHCIQQDIDGYERELSRRRMATIGARWTKRPTPHYPGDYAHVRDCAECRA